MRRIVPVLLLCCLFALLGSSKLEHRIGTGEDAGLIRVSAVSYDTVTVLICCEETIDENTENTFDAADSAHDEWPASAPDVILRDTEAQYMRFAEVQRANPDQSPGAFEANRLIATGYLDAVFPVATERNGMIWVDLDTIPDGANIINAEICFSVAVNFGTADGYIAGYADTTAADTAWVSTDLYTGVNVRELKASWNEYDDINNEDWAPALNDRTLHENLGVRGLPVYGLNTAGSSLTLNVTDGLQHTLDKGTYCGWWIDGEYDPAQMIRLTRVAWDAGHSEDLQPFVKVTYTTANHESPFPGGAKYAFIFTTDDGHGDNLEFYEPCFSDRGKRYQAYIRNGDYGAAYMNDAELLTLYQTGTVDMGTHTASHYYDTTMPPDSTFGYILDADSLMAELHTSWLADKIGVDSTAIKSVAYPSCSWGDPTVQFIIDNLPQLKGGRSCGTDTGHYPTWYADVDTNVVDGGIWGVDVRSHWPTHLLSSYTQNEVETKADSLKATMGIGDMWVILSHHVAEADTQHVGWLLDHLIADGDWWICTYDEYIDRYRSLHDMTDQWLPEWNW